jgi:hypothetical protein
MERMPGFETEKVFHIPDELFFTVTTLASLGQICGPGAERMSEFAADYFGPTFGFRSLNHFDV